MSFNEYWQAEQQRRAVAEAIAALQPGDRAAHERFYHALQQALLLLPVEALPEGLASGERLVGKEVSVQVKMVEGQDNKRYLPLFTGEATLAHARGDEPAHLLVSFPTLAQMAIQARLGGIIVDQGGPASAVVQLPVLVALARQRTEPRPTPVGGPAEAPAATPALRVGPAPRVVEHREIIALGEWARRQPGLAQAYLFGLVQGGQPPMLAVGLGFREAPPQEQMQALARELHDVLGPAGVLWLSPPLTTLLARQAGAIHFDLRELGSEVSN